jgi:hypothetical protein
VQPAGEFSQAEVAPVSLAHNSASGLVHRDRACMRTNFMPGLVCVDI